MSFFGWLGGSPDPPDRWDLRSVGWDLCHGHEGCRADCKHVLLCDTRALSPAERIGLVENEQRLRQAARNVKRYLQSMGVNASAA